MFVFLLAPLQTPGTYDIVSEVTPMREAGDVSIPCEGRKESKEGNIRIPEALENFHQVSFLYAVTWQSFVFLLTHYSMEYK